jgi:hypothetical protein
MCAKPRARTSRPALLRSALVEAKAEGVPGWVEQHSDVLLRLEAGVPCAGFAMGTSGPELATVAEFA